MTTPVTLPGTQSRTLRAAANGCTYRISLWVPPGPAPAGGFPAICVLDANALFGTFVEALRRSSRRPDATGIDARIVIGIAHDGDELFANAQRQRDFTLGPAAGSTAQADDHKAFGGAPAFLGFIVDELLPALRRELPLNPARTALFGHSLAGQFVLQALAARPRAFSHWAAISPSIWWDEAPLHQRLAAALPGSGARAFLAVGEWEGELPPWQRDHPAAQQTAARRAQRRMVERARTLAGALGEWLGEGHVLFRLFPEEDHASVLMIATQRVLRWCSA